MKTYDVKHLIRMENLNHHHNLYAGRAIEWMIEAGYVAATIECGQADVLFRNCHQFSFFKSIELGELVTFRAQVARVGRSSLTIHVDCIEITTGELRAEGYATFVTIRPGTHEVLPHGIALDETEDQEVLRWRSEAEAFFKK